MSKTLVGVLIDVRVLFSAFDERMTRLFLDSYQLAFDEAYEDGVLDRPVEMIVQEVDGLPTGSVHEALEGWKALAAQGVVGILGPMATENAIDIREYIDREGHIPSISWAGSDLSYGEWVFGVTNGSLPDEPYLMANYLAHEGHERIAVLYEDSSIGLEYVSFFRDACKYEGLRIVIEEPISQIQGPDMAAPIRALRGTEPDAVAYLGLGLPTVYLNDELEHIGWDPPRIMNTAFMVAAFSKQGQSKLKGWAGIEQYDEENPIGQSMLDRFEARHGYRPANFLPLVCYDAANVLAHGIGKAYPISPAGVKRGLERVKMLPAATGGRGTYLSFAPHVRRGWLGADYLVVRKADTDKFGTPLGDLGSRLVHRWIPRTREQRKAART